MNWFSVIFFDLENVLGLMIHLVNLKLIWHQEKPKDKEKTTTTNGSYNSKRTFSSYSCSAATLLSKPTLFRELISHGMKAARNDYRQLWTENRFILTWSVCVCVCVFEYTLRLSSTSFHLDSSSSFRSVRFLCLLFCFIAFLLDFVCV